MAKNTLSSNEQKFQKAASGCNTTFPPKTQVPLGGKTYTPVQLAATFTAGAAGISDLAKARASVAGLVQSEKVTTATADALYKLLETYLRITLGESNPQLANFGMKGRKQPTSTATARAAGANQAVKTKKGLGPLGAKERKAAAKALKAGAAVTAPAGSSGGPTGSGK